MVEELDDEEDEVEELDEDEDEDDRSSSHEDGNPKGENEQLPDYLTDPVWNNCLEYIRSVRKRNAEGLDPSKAHLSLNLIIYKLKKNLYRFIFVQNLFPWKFTLPGC